MNNGLEKFILDYIAAKISNYGKIPITSYGLILAHGIVALALAELGLKSDFRLEFAGRLLLIEFLVKGEVYFSSALLHTIPLENA